MLCEVEQEVELAARQVDLVAAGGHLAPRGVDADAAGLDGRLARGRRRHGLADGAGAPQRRPDARDDLLHAERLGDVVVGAHLQPDDAVELVGAGRQHEDVEERVRRAEPPAHLDAVQAGQHHVQHHEVRRRPLGLGGLDGGQGVGPGRRRVDGVAGVAEAAREEGAEVVVVLDDQEPGGRSVGHAAR